MEYVYAAMLLHKAGKKVDESSVKKVLEAAGISPDETRIKALVASLEGVDIDKAIETAQVVAAAAPASSAPAKEEKKADKEEEKKTEEMAAAGLGALFG
ncbi:MAG: 50S ribosomal protein P1 [Candidatus Woesearchaeota archaeon]|jgi:large subunit ribosomal protein L12|nr:50S ribosomal protein P1 [Candidatus Woesearchaeota archaeon]